MAGRRPESAHGRRSGPSARPAPRRNVAARRPTGSSQAPRSHLGAGVAPAPGQVGLAVGAAAAAVAALIAVTGDGQAYWLCVPVALAAAAVCGAPHTSALAVAVVVVTAVLSARVDCPQPPALWAALAVPLASVAVLQWVRATLERDRDGLRDFALTDPLTGVSNRRALLAAADHEIARHRRSERPFAVVMVDLDGFKQVNDRFGHAAGDDLLRDVAAALARAMRGQDTVARFGGDEFCVLAPDTDAAGAEPLCERVSAAIRGVTAGVQSVRGSVGAAVFPDDGGEPGDLIDVADLRLLEAKRTLYRERGRAMRRAA
jgi:diguanylate cyclase (GGDEF)-like protein